MATVTKYPAAYTTQGSINGTRYRNAVGKDSGTTASGNDYASGGSNATATITYTFDFSDIPAGASINVVEVKVGGHAEASTYSSQRKCEFQLYSGSTAKGDMAHFSSTSKQVITMTPGTWTRDELQQAQLRVTIGYYGGLVNGVDFTVDYTEAATGTNLRVKVNGVQKRVSKILKKSGGAYSEIGEGELDQNAHYHFIT